MSDNIIPIFYACDDSFLNYAITSLTSMIENASKDFKYHVHILHTNIKKKKQDKVIALSNDNFTISFDDVSPYLEKISDKMPIRDYYTRTTYFRLFIAEMFQEYNKAIYIDGDTIVKGDISKLYNTDIEGYYLGACHEKVMIKEDVFGTYVEKVIGISRYNFFNAGVLLINCEEFRLHYVLDKFIDYLYFYNFVVTQDEDYLNLICKDHVYFLDESWNYETITPCDNIENINIIHYIMTNKPWHYKDALYSDIFYSYAEKTENYNEILNVLNNYSEKDKEKDKISSIKLKELALNEIKREDNFLNKMNKTKRDKGRVEILKKIEQYEREGRFSEDVEDDPESRELLPDEINYLKKKISEKLKTKAAFAIARKFVKNLIDQKKLIIKEIKGIEHFKNLESGAVITCNHFNAFDSFAIQLAYDKAEQPKRTFYRVIREGNYTTFPGFYGFLMRHCNTLPLSSNISTMKKFLSATTKLLKDGNFILVYPEQSMWWNYRKPKPLQKGAFKMAVNANVPVLPCFITMKDSDIKGEDGFYVQEYTINIKEPIYPDKSLSKPLRVCDMLDKNYEIWKNIYEKVYQIPLTYEQK